MNKTIFTGFAPNLKPSDILTAMSFLLLPWKWNDWKNGEASRAVEKKIERYLDTESAITFDSGRSALYAALLSRNISKGDEVMVQAYTCVVVINAIKATGATPIYVDADDVFCTSYKSVKAQITPKTKAIIIQHTFGTLAEVEKIVSLAKEKHILTIEDGAHAYGLKSAKKRFAGTFADIGMFSFGSDKSLSCARGGALITSNESIEKSLKQIQQQASHVSRYQIFRHLMHFPIFLIGKATYHVYIGKVLLKVSRSLRLINDIISPSEKKGSMPYGSPFKLPNALATILLSQLEDIDAYNDHRKNIANIYNKELLSSIKKPITKDHISTYLRYPILVKNPKHLHDAAKKEGILLGNWYNTVIAPADIEKNNTNYQKGSCPKAEELALTTVNLPTNVTITPQKAKRIVEVINRYYAHR